MMHEHGKSDLAIVAVKPANEAERPGGAGGAKGGDQGECGPAKHGPGTVPGNKNVSQELERIRQAARQRKGRKSSPHSSTTSALASTEAFFQLKEDAAPGVDGLTWQEYEQHLEGNLADLHARIHRGAYRALPARRVYIPKPDGRQRPLAIAALEDKIVQRAAAAVLNAIYEEDFLGFSYGFRPGRGTHDAMDALFVGIESKQVNWILDADIQSFFDEISQEKLVGFLEQRIGDRRIIRLIQKWLKVGVLEDGIVKTVTGEPGKGR